MIRRDYPCKGCKDGHLGCHSECHRYITVKENREKDREERIKKQGTNEALNTLHGNRLKSLRRGHR